MGDDMFEDFGMGMGGSSQVSFSSSSFSGGNGVTYSSSTTTRIGPGGVRETQSSVKDGRTGKESLTIDRSLGDRRRMISKSRNSRTGEEQTTDNLYNLQAGAEADAFDDEWLAAAERRLP